MEEDEPELDFQSISAHVIKGELTGRITQLQDLEVKSECFSVSYC